MLYMLYMQSSSIASHPVQVARVGVEGSDMSEMTGTPLFMALSVAWGDPHTVSSDLESLFYSLLYIASDGKASRTLNSHQGTSSANS